MISESFDLYLLKNSVTVNSLDDTNLDLKSAQNEQGKKTNSTDDASEDEYLEVDIKDDADDETVLSEDLPLVKEDDSDSSTDVKSDENASFASDTKLDSSLETENEKDDAQGIDIKEFKNIISENSKKDELMAEYGYDKIFDYIDENNDGQISDEEIKNLGFDITDIKNLTVENIQELAKLAGLPVVSLEDDNEDKNKDDSIGLTPELLEKLKKAFSEDDNSNVLSEQTVNTASPVNYSYTPANTGVSGGNISSANYSNSNASSKAQPDEMSMDELLDEKQTKQNALSDANSKVADVMSNNDVEVKAAIENSDNKQEEYEKCLKEDEKISDELKERQENNQKDIESKEKAICDKETEIVEAEAKIQNLDSEISLIDNKISALNASLAALPDKTEDNQSRHSEIDAQKANIESQIADAKNDKQAKEDEKSEIKDKKNDNEKELEELKDELKELEDERADIEDEILNSCSNETKQKLEAWQDARENIETVKNERLALFKEEVQTAQDELDEVNSSIMELENMQIQLQNRVGDEGEDVVDFATKLDGLSASEMKQIMQAAGCRFDDGAWCADFVTYVTKQIYGNDSTPGNFANSCSNTASCTTIGAWADANGILTTDSSQVEPGDFILYPKNGSYGHIGIVTSVNADGTVNTVEGNTSYDNGSYNGGVVNQWTGRTGSYVLMHKLA